MQWGVGHAFRQTKTQVQVLNGIKLQGMCNRDQTSGDVQHDGTSPVGNMHGETAVEGMKVGNPCAMDEEESENLELQPKFQQLDNADFASDRHVVEGNCESTPSE